MNDDERRLSSDQPAHDPVAILLRLLVGGTAEVTDAIVSGLFAPRPSESSGESHAALARQALIGLLFEAYGAVGRGASTVERWMATTGRFWGSVLEPVVRSRLFAPVRLSSEYLIERGAQELERWARIGRGEEQQSREVARRLMMIPVDDIVTYLRANPELERLVRAQAQSLLDELADDPRLSSVIRRQGDVYVDHLQENPQAVQTLVRGQSVGLAEEVANSVRQRTVSADILLERIVRTMLRRKPRKDLPGPSREVRDRADTHWTHSDEGE